MQASAATTLAPGPRPSRPRSAPPGVILVVILSGILIVAMSVVGTSVALPEIAADLRTSGPGLQWAVAAYNLAFAAFTLVFGSIADIMGRRRMFVLGTIALAAGGIISASSIDIVMLDISRGIAGLGGAAIMASGGALLASTFSGARQVRAFAAMGATAGVGISLGPLVSGWLVNAFDWRAVLIAHGVIAILILIGSSFIPESRAVGRHRVRPTGVVLFVGGIALLMFGVVEGPDTTWRSPLVLGALVAGPVLLGMFVAHQRRSTEPVFDVSLVRQRHFSAWCLAVLATVLAFPGVLVYLPTWLQSVNESSAGAAGAQLLMLTLPVLLLPSVAGWLVTRGVSARLLIGASLLLMGLGNAWLTVTEPGIASIEIFGPLLALGIGMGVSFGITDGQAMKAVDPDRVGMTAGFLNTIRGAGEAMVIAAFGAALISAIDARVNSLDVAKRVAAGNLEGPRDFLAEQFTNSWHLLNWIVAGICLLAAVTVVAMLAPVRNTPQHTTIQSDQHA